MYDDLFARPPGGTGNRWIDRISAECHDWIDQLVDEIHERGEEPNWRAVHRHIKTHFPDDSPNTDNTVRDTVRGLVERG